jgi:hypothetical protein
MKAAFFLSMGYHPHQTQWDLLHARYERFITECWPRQHGKSTGVAHEALFEAAEQSRRLIWLVAPTYDLCEPEWDVLEQAAVEKCNWPEFRPVKMSRRDWYIDWSNGSRIVGRSADNETTLQGRRLDRLFVLEAASISENRIYEQYLRPMLAVNHSPGMFVSTPKGFNWFFDLAQRGMDPLQTDYYFGHAKLGCSPYVTADEIEEARRTLPERVFQQEWEAQFISDAGAVFRGVKDCVMPGCSANQEPIESHFYAAGVDLARMEDYSVITVVDRVKKRQVYFDRFNEVDWHRQIPLFANVVKKYGDCPVLVDSTGIGDPIYDFMRQCGMRVYPYNFCGNRKEELMDALALSIEKRELSLMDIPVQTNELIGYEYHRTKTGKLSMSAPGKQHDDCVVGLALAWWQGSRGTGQVQTVHRGWRM